MTGELIAVGVSSVVGAFGGVKVGAMLRPGQSDALWMAIEIAANASIAALTYYLLRKLL